VTILNDTISEATETFVFSIVNVSSLNPARPASTLAPRTALIDILDDENPVVDPPDPPLVSNFTVTEQPILSGVSPISFQFAPHNPQLIYIAEKQGTIKVFDLAASAVVRTFADLSAKVNSANDRGLLDIALHPDFPNNPYVYVFYVVDPPETQGQFGNAGMDGFGNRFAYVSRLTADVTTNYQTMLPGSEVILVGGAGSSLSDISGGGALDYTDPAYASRPASDFVNGEFVQDYIKVDSITHAGGALAFGPDGALYVSIGDGTSYNYADPRTPSVQNLDSLSGKILRIDPMTGDGSPDNPFVQPGDSLDLNSAKVYQIGLRNPFTMGFDPDGRLFITETGWNTFEEINTGGAGANFGWPWFEGGDSGLSARTGDTKTSPRRARFTQPWPAARSR
jgi:glucose/arabinose dehydrogenase